MLIIPKDLPYTSDFHSIFQAFDTNQISKEDQQTIAHLNEERRKFYTFFSQMNTKFYREITVKESNNLKSYLFNTFDLMEVLCTKASRPMPTSYHSSFSNGVTDFKMNEDNDTHASAEIIFSRYCYAFGLLRSLEGAYKELIQCKGNFAELSKRVKLMLTTVEDAAVRMAKLFYLKDVVWSGLEKSISKYSGVAEFNYFLLEGVYL